MSIELLSDLHRGDGRQNPAGDLIRITLGVRPAIFEIALVTVLREAVRNADRSTPVRHAVSEFMDGLGLVKAGQTQVVVRSVDGNVFGLVLVKRRHERLEV